MVRESLWDVRLQRGKGIHKNEERTRINKRRVKTVVGLPDMRTRRNNDTVLGNTRTFALHGNILGRLVTNRNIGIIAGSLPRDQRGRIPAGDGNGRRGWSFLGKGE